MWVCMQTRGQLVNLHFLYIFLIPWVQWNCFTDILTLFGPLFMPTKIPLKLMMSCRRNVSLQQNGIVFCLLFSPLLFKILQPSNPGSETTLCHLNCQLHKVSPEPWAAETNKQEVWAQPILYKSCVQEIQCLLTNNKRFWRRGSQANLLTTTQDKGLTYPHNIYFTIVENWNAVPRK